MERANRFAAMSYYGLYISAEGAYAQSDASKRWPTTWPTPTPWASSATWPSCRPGIAKRPSADSTTPARRSVNDLGGGVRVAEHADRLLARRVQAHRHPDRHGDPRRRIFHGPPARRRFSDPRRQLHVQLGRPAGDARQLSRAQRQRPADRHRSRRGRLAAHGRRLRSFKTARSRISRW